MTNSPSVMALCETGLDRSILEQDFTIPGYCPLISKPDHQHRKGHGLGVYIKEGFPCGRDLRYEVTDSPYMCFRVALLHSTAFIFTLYRPHGDGCSVIDHIADQVDKIFTDHPSASIHICGDFNVHHEEWLVHSNNTDREGRICYDFSIVYGLTQIVDQTTRVPKNSRERPNLLDLFLTNCPEFCTATVESPLGSSDHSVISVRVDIQCKESSDVPYHRTIYRYSKADWDGFRNFIADAPLEALFQGNPSEMATSITEWIQTGIDIFIPHKKYQQKPNSQPWFTPECAAAICQRNHFFHKYQRNRTAENLQAFKASRRECRESLRQAKNRYSKQARDSIARQKLGSKDFWRICNSVLKRNKSSLPSLRSNTNRMATSSADKDELLCEEFAKVSSLDDGGRFPPSFLPRTGATLATPSITVRQVRKIINCLDVSKACGPDGIPAIVYKKCAPELAPALS